MMTQRPEPPLTWRDLFTLDVDELIALAPWRHWLKQFLVGNPFYLLSAAMMLYGMYLVSIDPQLAGQEVSQLAFNFSSLQLYEVLLMVTAVLFARRAIWYEATMLTLLQHSFVFIPFILISQATLITNRVAWVVCVAATVFAVFSYGMFKRHLREANLPAGLLLIGVALLAINLTLPVFFRTVIEWDNEGWSRTSPWLWFLLFPGVVVAANWLPRAPRFEGPGLQRSWMPWLTLGLWMGGSLAHLWSIDYLDDRKFYHGLLAPTAWVAMWVLRSRIGDFLADGAAGSGRWPQVLAIMPALAPLLALDYPTTSVFMTLCVLNAAIYALLLARQRANPVLLHLLLATFTAAVAGVPDSWGHFAIPDYTRFKCVTLSLAAYALFWCILSRRPGAAVAGALLTGLGTQYLMDKLDYVEQYAMQHALIFALLHSLRWEVWAGRRRALCVAAALGWVAHSFTWGYIVGMAAGWSVALGGLLVLGFCLLSRMTRNNWGPMALWLSAATVVATVPVNYVIAVLSITPNGHLTILGSFILFALGTAAALTKERWGSVIERAPREDGAVV
ncbi:MAG: hypothetical protein AB1705_25985 [Verrucomicrobiota bacterium]